MEKETVFGAVPEEERRVKNRMIVAAGVVLLAALAAVRTVDIVRASADADVMSSGALVTALGIIESVLSVLALAFSGGVLVYVSDRGTRRQAFLCAALFTGAFLLDRGFYVAYSAATRVRTFLPGAGASAYIRIASDFASVAAAYFITAAAVSARKNKRDDADPAPFGAAIFAAVLTAMQLAYQTYVTVDFHLTYDDVTSVERSQIAGDYLFIVLKFGVVTFGCALFAYRASERFIARKRKNDDKNQRKR